MSQRAARRCMQVVMEARLEAMDLSAQLLKETDWIGGLAAQLIGDAHAAEDLAQDTRLAALQAPVKGDRPMRPWLATVARNGARMLRRSEGSRRAREAESAAIVARREVRSPDQMLEALETQEVVLRFVRELPADLSAVLIETFVEDRSPSEIAKLRGIPAGTVRWRKKEALMRLRERLETHFRGDRAAWFGALLPLAEHSLRKKAAATAAGSAAGSTVSYQAASWGALWITMSLHWKIVTVSSVSVASLLFMRTMSSAGSLHEVENVVPMASGSAMASAQATLPVPPAGEAAELERVPIALASGLDPVPGPATEPVASEPQADTLEAVEDYLARCAEHGWSGVAYVESRGKVLLQRGYGLADRRAKRKHAKDTLFEIASATKPITACAVLALVEDGMLALDDSIAEHLPGVPDDKRAITIEHLLAHRSGMPRTAAGGHGHDLEKAVAGYLSAPLVREPGTDYEYWNGGYALLAGVISKAAGRTYQDYCRARLFQRAELKSTGFTGDTHLPAKRLAIGYRGEEKLRAANDHPYGEYGYQYLGMGGVVSSVNDLVLFARAFDAGKILSPESVERMLASPSPLGWQVSETSRGTRRIGHGGDVGGFHTQWQRFPDDDAQVIVFSNEDAVPLFQLAWNIESLLFNERPGYPIPPRPGKIERSELAAAEGTYASPSGARIDVSREGDRLVLKPAPVDAETLRDRTPLEGEDAKVGRFVEEIVTALDSGDVDAIIERLSPSVPRTWPGRLVRSVWTEHVATHGAFERAVALEVSQPSNGYQRILLRLEHANGVRPLTVGLSQGKLSFFQLRTKIEEYEGTYTWTEDGTFAAFDWEPGGVPTVSFDGGAKKRLRLTIRDRGRAEVLERVK